MSLLPWRGMMGQVIRVAARSGHDGMGAPTFGSDASYRGRLVGKRQLVRNELGQEVVSSQTAYLFTGDNVLPSARVTLSTADVGSTESWALSPPILATARYPDETGRMAHTALFLA